MKNTQALIVFQKNGILGKVKTRLAATLGDQAALDIYRKLISITHEEIRELSKTDVHLFFSENNEIPGVAFPYEAHIQEGNDLGEKMANAFEKLFLRGYKKILIIGTDCPWLKKEHLEEAFKSLDSHKVVFGPAMDGGYYLLGMKEPRPELFSGIPWSTDKVLQLSIEKLQSQGVSFDFTDQLSDVDTAEDWEHYLRISGLEP